MALRVLVVDNYDSFTFNLVQYLGELGALVDVVKNDAITAAEILQRAPDGLLLSPGPCTPNEAGVCLEAIAKAAGTLPILGVCLGHQAIGQAFGGKVVRAGRLMHGKTSPIEHDGRGVFAGLSQPFEATRYHSLLVDRTSLPSCLSVTAWTSEGEIMGLSHATLDVHGVQFHPESVLTTEGKKLLGNWVAHLEQLSSRARSEAEGTSDPDELSEARSEAEGTNDPDELSEARSEAEGTSDPDELSEARSEAEGTSDPDEVRAIARAAAETPPG